MVLCSPQIPEEILSFNVGDDLQSQHSTVSVSVPIKIKEKKIYSNRPDFKKANWKKFHTLIDELLPTPEELSITNKTDLDTAIKLVTEAIEKADIKAILR